MSSTSQGHQAEVIVGDYLKLQGYQILATNWRTRRCEIDLVAQKGDIVYFIEVKFRHTNAQGSGFDYITPAKIKQISFAAEVWVAQHRYGGDYELLAAEVNANGKVNIQPIF